MITLRLNPRAPVTPTTHIYRLAGQTLVSDSSLPELAPFAVARPATGLPPPSDPPSMPEDTQLVHRGLGWLDNRWRGVECRWSSRGYWVSVAEAGVFWVAPEGRSLTFAQPDPDTNPGTVVQAAMGPVLILGLALQDTWCLHASAVAVGESVIAFLGDSASGKSTLAAFLGSAAGLGWRVVADDILPVTLGSGGAELLPRYPQLKLPLNAQPSIGQPERLSLSAVYLLDSASRRKARVHIERLTSRAAALALVRHTAAARLFGRKLLVRHLEACSAAALTLPVSRLSFPRHLDLLPVVRDAIATHLDALRP